MGLIGWGGLAITALLGLTSGLGGALVMAGVFAFVVAVVALVRGRVSWAHLGNRLVGLGVLVASLVVMSVGAAVSTAPASSALSDGADRPSGLQPNTAEAAAVPSGSSTTPSRTSSPSSTTSAPAPSTKAPSATTSATPAGEPGTALALLGTLTVKGRAPMTGYARENFGAAWTDIDRNGCDQRNDTLRRDLKSVTLKPRSNGCAVMTGTLTDPYTGSRISFVRSSSSYSPVQIDHVVALANAWVMGAARWDSGKRVRFANDPLNLLAVSGTANAAKGPGDAATWLPAVKSYRCSYVARQVAVKAKYGLAVTRAERAAVSNILSTCPMTKVPTATVARLGGFPLYVAPATTPTPKPSPTSPKPKPSSTSTILQGVHPGAFCSPQGALGYTSKGTLMRCSTKPGDSRARWRSA